MSELSDRKLERFARELLLNVAADMPRSKAAQDAAQKAGYTGRSLGPNARKRAQRKDVKARMAELAAPALAEAQQEVTASVDLVTRRLLAIIMPDLGVDAIKVADQIQASRQLCQIHGWMAVEKHQHDVSDRLAQMMNEIDGRTRGLPSGT